MQLANNKKKEEEITINIQNNYNFLKRTVIGKFVFNDDSHTYSRGIKDNY